MQNKQPDAPCLINGSDIWFKSYKMERRNAQVWCTPTSLIAYQLRLDLAARNIESLPPQKKPNGLNKIKVVVMLSSTNMTALQGYQD